MSFILNKTSWEYNAYLEVNELNYITEYVDSILPPEEDVDFLTESRAIMDYMIDRHNDGLDIINELNALYTVAVMQLCKVDPHFFGEGQKASDHVFALITEKQHDYGHGNILKFGLFGVLIRMHDKVARLENLMKKKERRAAIHESISDSLMDIMGYSIICRMLIAGTFELDIECDPRHLRYAVDTGDFAGV